MCTFRSFFEAKCYRMSIFWGIWPKFCRIYVGSTHRGPTDCRSLRASKFAYRRVMPRRVHRNIQSAAKLRRANSHSNCPVMFKGHFSVQKKTPEGKSGTPNRATTRQQPGMDRAMHDFFQAGGDHWVPRTGQPQDFDPAAPAGGMSGMSLQPFSPISARVRPTRAYLIDDFLPRSLTDSYSQLTAQGAYQFAVDPTSGTFSLVPDVRIGQPKSSKVRCPNLAVFLARPIRPLTLSLLLWGRLIRWNMICTRPICSSLPSGGHSRMS
jgi:hypothetical protein